ncbi:GlpF Glycerol uptake facilitator and related permeases (Major Intrinsic Protein Family) [Candidatus Nanopelagicaceae bacterium]
MLRKKLFAEFLGTAVLVATVVGSGIMATNLSPDLGIDLLINTVATVFVLYILITLFAPISGAHFNPLVSGIAFFRKELSAAHTLYFFIVQILGGSLGAIIANLMFEHPAIEPSNHVRNGSHLLLGEVIASAGLIFIIFLAIKQGIDKKIPRLVAAWIGAAYFFTSSTSFANPAVTIARGLTDSLSGIKFSSVPAFIAAQIVGAVLGYSGFKYLTTKAKSGK